MPAKAGERPKRYFFGEISAEVALVLGGEVAVPGGECAPEASSGLEAAGVTVAAYGPGSAQAGIVTGAGAAPEAGAAVCTAAGADALPLFRYSAATRSWDRQSL